MSEVNTQSKSKVIAVLYDLYRDKMYRIAYSIVKDIHLADDAVHDAILKILPNISVDADLTSVHMANYIIIAVKHAAIDIRRKQKKDAENISFGYEINTVFTEADEIAIENMKRKYGFSDEMMAILRKLRDVDKDIICLYYINGFQTSEIASMLNLTEVNVRKRMSRTRKKLAKLIEKEESSNEKQHEKSRRDIETVC